MMATSSSRSDLGSRHAGDERGADLRPLSLNVRGRTPLCAVVVTQLDTQPCTLGMLGDVGNQPQCIAHSPDH